MNNEGVAYERADLFRHIGRLIGRRSGSDLFIVLFTRGFSGSDLVIRPVLNISCGSYVFAQKEKLRAGSEFCYFGIRAPCKEPDIA